MPAELVQQVPYIRRALEAYRIPILELAGYEADDVIGTLARKAAAQSYLVYVVSSDKDMLQLVNDRVLVLNPPKDNLICDAEKGGRDPRRPARARGGRDGPARRLHRQHSRRARASATRARSKSSSVSARWSRPSIAPPRSRRNPIASRCRTIATSCCFSKRMATIDCDVPVDLDLDAMRAGAPDVEALRELFTELEFTSLLKELLPVVEVTEAHYTEAKSAADVEAVLKNGFRRTMRWPWPSKPKPASRRRRRRGSGRAAGEHVAPHSPRPPKPPPAQEHRNLRSRRNSANRFPAGKRGSRLTLRAGKRGVPKAIHDYKAAIHALEPQGITLPRGAA